jgi:murein DD-endopeptidase MepM/ murein hydrolase activator NlpD
MKRPSLPFLFLAAVILLASAPETGWSRDPTVGSCTQKGPFAKRQQQVDVFVRKLTAASSEKRKASLASSMAKKFGTSAIENLIRYREPDMKLVFLRLLKHKKWPVRARALYGLKMVGDVSSVDAIGASLKDKDPRVREMAANALSHMGGEKGKEILQARKAEEKEAHVPASVEAARQVLEGGEKPYDEYKRGKVWKETLTGPEGARRVEWVWVKKGEKLFNDYDARAPEPPVAEAFVYPVSEYKTDLFCRAYPRRSFAANGNHAGEDCAWFREGCSYYAIADGVTRMVQGAGGDWGFLVILEHKLPSGDFIVSVYGHAGWDVLVRPGDPVKKGQKIATQGLSCSVENGGYGSHIHFGIGDGPFRRSRKHPKGSTLTVKDGKGKGSSGTVIRIVYAGGTKDRYGFPRLAAVVRLPNGEAVEQILPDEEMKDQVGWLQAYIAGCKGWLNPEKFLPKRVEGK